MQNESMIYDMAGIGIGPFNLGLAALSSPLKNLQTIFFDARSQFTWHDGLMLDFSKMQVPFLADLVTGADPTNPYSYLAYLKRTGQLYQFAILEDPYILRKEYNAYCRWVSEQLSNLRFSHTVVDIVWDEKQQFYILQVISQEASLKYFARRLVIGIGSEPYTPPCLSVASDDIFHASNYRYQKNRLLQQKSVTVIGSGQSAAEIFYDLLMEKETAIQQLYWCTRSARFQPMETGKMTLEMTSPDYIQYFYSLTEFQKEKTLSGQHFLYKGINQELLTAIYEALHRYKSDSIQCYLIPNSELQTIQDDTTGKYELVFQHLEKNEEFRLEADAVVLATGYRTSIPAFLEGLKGRICLDQMGRYQVNAQYAIDTTGSTVFVQNAELHSHGFNASDLGMGPYRNAVILNAILGYEHYAIEKNIAFQIFDPLTMFPRTF